MGNRRMQSCQVVDSSAIILETLWMGRLAGRTLSKQLTMVVDLRLQDKDPSKDIIQWDLLWYSFGANQQLFDLGVDREDALSKARLEESITKVDNDFELVMITELMYESLVLLADLLCIPLENVAVLKNINERPKDRVKQLTQKQEGTLRKFLQPDQMLYEHFKERLQKQIRFRERLRKMRDTNTTNETLSFQGIWKGKNVSRCS